MVMGRPPIHDPEYLMNELLIWARLPDSLNINAFCHSIRPEIDPDYLKALARKDEDFSRVFRIVKTYLANRREEANCEKILSDCAFNRNLHHYDQFLYDHSKDEQKYQSDLRKSEEGAKPQQVIIKVTNDGLGAGVNVSTKSVSNTSDQSAQ